MRSIDTCILARLIVQDDQPQAEAAARELDKPSFIPLTVVLETVWLLSSRYKLRRQQIVESLNDIFRLASVMVEEGVGVEWALARYLAGADVADMIHLVAARHTQAFLTFDQAIGKHSATSPVAIELLTA